MVLDMRGQPCPIPVVNARKALAEMPENDKSEVLVIVDNIVAVQNLQKMAKGTGCAFHYEEDESSPSGKVYNVSITKGDHFAPPSDEATKPLAMVNSVAHNAPHHPDKARGPVVLITADSMGRGAEDLGKLLVKGFIFSLTQLNPPPKSVIFLNGGVHLTKQGASSVPDLKRLQENGTSIYTCGTCANYYQTTAALAVGSIVDMMAITTALAQAASIITV